MQAEKTVKDVKLEELFPWRGPKTPNLNDFSPTQREQSKRFWPCLTKC